MGRADSPGAGREVGDLGTPEGVGGPPEGAVPAAPEVTDQLDAGEGTPVFVGGLDLKGGQRRELELVEPERRELYSDGDRRRQRVHGVSGVQQPVAGRHIAKPVAAAVVGDGLESPLLGLLAVEEEDGEILGHVSVGLADAPFDAGGLDQAGGDVDHVDPRHVLVALELEERHLLGAGEQPRGGHADSV